MEGTHHDQRTRNGSSSNFLSLSEGPVEWQRDAVIRGHSEGEIAESVSRLITCGKRRKLSENGVAASRAKEFPLTVEFQEELHGHRLWHCGGNTSIRVRMEAPDGSDGDDEGNDGYRLKVTVYVPSATLMAYEIPQKYLYAPQE